MDVSFTFDSPYISILADLENSSTHIKKTRDSTRLAERSNQLRSATCKSFFIAFVPQFSQASSVREPLAPILARAPHRRFIFRPTNRLIRRPFLQLTPQRHLPLIFSNWSMLSMPHIKLQLYLRHTLPYTLYLRHTLPYTSWSQITIVSKTMQSRSQWSIRVDVSTYTLIAMACVAHCL